MPNVISGRIAGFIMATSLLAACQAPDPMSGLDQNAIDPAACASSRHSSYYACRSVQEAAKDRLHTDESRCYDETHRSIPLDDPVAWMASYNRCMVLAGHHDEVAASKRRVQTYLESPASKAAVRAIQRQAEDAIMAVREGGSSWIENGQQCYSRPTPTGTWVVSCQ